MVATLLIHLGVAVAVTVGVLLAAHALARAGEGRWALPPALGVGYAVGHALIRRWEWPPPWPLDAWDWLPYLAATSGAAGAVVAAFDVPGGEAWSNAGRLLLTALSVALLIGPVAGGGGGSASWDALRLATVAAAWLVAWGGFAAMAGRVGAGVAGPLLIVAMGSAAVFWLSAIYVLAVLAVLSTVTVAAAWWVGRFHGGLAWGRGAVGVPVVVLGGLLTAGVVYGEVPPACALILAAAPATAWVDRFPASARLATGWRWAILLVVSTTVVAGAVVLAARSAPAGSF